jgi:phosphate transporter
MHTSVSRRRWLNLFQVVSTFISHTIAAVLLVPIAQAVGSSHPGGDYERLLIFLTALLCSTGMGMPVSGFPNQTA